MKKKQIIGLLAAILLCLSGCSQSAVVRDTLSLSKDGTAVYTIVTDFAEPNYDLEELKAMAAEEVSEYGTGVQITEALVEEGVLTFQYSFDSLNHYAAFMETACYQGTVAQALKAGYKPDTVLTAAKGNTTVQMKELDSDTHHLFIWNEHVSVRCTGDVLYHSSNLSTDGKRDVVPSAEASGPYYVIYK